MAYRVVRGQFGLMYQGATRRVGSRPDGDSVWFMPDNPVELHDLPTASGGTRDAAFNGGGFAQLRFEAIDATELHYGGLNHQALPETVAPRDHLLAHLGFTRIDYSPTSNSGGPDSYVRSSTPAFVRGYIMCRAIDPFARPVAFVFTGDPPASFGDEEFLRVAHMQSSVNFDMVTLGLVYPSFYQSLPVDLRQAVAQASIDAHDNDVGLWQQDRTRRSQIDSISDLSNRVIFPKLYRRLFRYFKDPATPNDPSGFDAWVRAVASRDDELLVIHSGEIANMHDIIRTSARYVMMDYEPWEISIRPR